MPRLAYAVVLLAAAAGATACCPTMTCDDGFSLELPAVEGEGVVLEGSVDGAAYRCARDPDLFWDCDREGVGGYRETIGFVGTPRRVLAVLRRGDETIATDTLRPEYREKQIGNSFCSSCNVAEATLVP